MDKVKSGTEQSNINKEVSKDSNFKKESDVVPVSQTQDLGEGFKRQTYHRDIDGGKIDGEVVTGPGYTSSQATMHQEKSWSSDGDQEKSSSFSKSSQSSSSQDSGVSQPQSEQSQANQ